MNGSASYRKKTKLTEIDLKLAEVRIPQPDTRVVFRSQSLPLEQLIAELGEVFEEEVSAVPNYKSMKPVVTIGKEGTTAGELAYPHAVAIDSNNRIFVTEGNSISSHPSVSVFSDRGEFLSSFKHQDMKCPYGVAIHGDNLYVTDGTGHAVFHFKVKTEFSLITKQGTKGHQIGQFNNSRNLAVSTTGDLYVATECKS